MKYLYIFLPLILIACAGSFADKDPVLEIVDGDTIRMHVKGPDEDSTRWQRLRLCGIDAPESRNYGKKRKEPFGEEAAILLDSLMGPGYQYRLEYDVQLRDKYGRLLVYIFRSDGLFINEFMLKAGLAQVLTIPPNVKYAERFFDAQKFARENQKGMWQ